MPLESASLDKSRGPGNSVAREKADERLPIMAEDRGGATAFPLRFELVLAVESGLYPGLVPFALTERRKFLSEVGVILRFLDWATELMRTCWYSSASCWNIGACGAAAFFLLPILFL